MKCTIYTQHKSHKLSFGFTLIELLVVITIISILSVVAVLSLNPIVLQQKARDSKRIADIATLSNLIQGYNIEHGVYPDAVDTERTSNTLPPGNSGPFASSESGWIIGPFSTTVAVIPIDPLNGNVHCVTCVYRYKHDANTFEIDAWMEFNKDKAGSDNGDNPDTWEVGNNLGLLH